MSKHAPDTFRGKWRLTSMPVWSQDALDLVEPAYFRFGEDDRDGEFAMIAVHGWLDCWYGSRDEKPVVEFSWEGMDERDPRSGRGWATLEQDGTLAGHFWFHRGDDSPFTARRFEEGPPHKRPSRRRGSR